MNRPPFHKIISNICRQYVLDFLKQKGFKVDEESVVNAIEAIVKQLNTEGLTIE